MRLPKDIAALSVSNRELSHYNTAELCLKSMTPTLASIIRAKGIEILEDWLVLLLVSLNQKLNLKRPMPQQTVKETAYWIHKNYPYFKVADIHLIFNRIVNGDMGEMYESLSMAKVLGWFYDYAEERMQQAEYLQHRHHEQHKEEARHRTLKDDNKFLSNLAAGLAGTRKEDG